MQTLTDTQPLRRPDPTNPVAVLQAWLRKVKVPVSQTTIRQTVENHPDYPSLLSLSDALDEWQIDNAALHLNSVEQLRELPTPFVAYHTAQSGFYVLVESVAGESITFVEPTSRQRQTETLEQFQQHWSGVVLLAEKTEQSGEADYATLRRNERLNALRLPFAVASIGLLLLLALSVVLPTLTGLQAVWLLTKAVGLTLSIALVMKQLGHSNALTGRFCQTLSKAGCESVLQSPAATVVGNVHWSDVGLVYFAGGLLAAFLSSTQPQVSPILGWLALLSLPYVVFSIYYQARVARQWCALCLGVQVVLLIESALALSQPLTLPTAFLPYAAFAGAFLLPTALWLVGKPLWQQANETDSLRRQLARFKNNPDLFAALLQKQPQAPLWRPDALITLGNPDAEHVLTVVTNPYCGPCAKMHRTLEELLSKRPNLRAEIIFLACDGPTGRATTVLRHLLALEDRVSALNDWYAQDAKDYEQWAKHWPVYPEQTPFERAKAHCDWCLLGKIEATPTLFIDGHKLPEVYKLADLQHVFRIAISMNAASATALNMDLAKSR